MQPQNKSIKRRKFTDKMGRNCSTHTQKKQKRNGKYYKIKNCDQQKLIQNDGGQVEEVDCGKKFKLLKLVDELFEELVDEE